MLFIIIYENLTIEDNYKMIEEIKSLGNFQHITSNVWLVISDSLTAKEINDKLNPCIAYPKHERLMTIELPNSIVYKGWMPKALWRWLNKYLKRQ